MDHIVLPTAFLHHFYGLYGCPEAALLGGGAVNPMAKVDPIIVCWA